MFLILKKDNGDFEATDQKGTPLNFLRQSISAVFMDWFELSRTRKRNRKEAPKYPIF